MLHGGTNVHRVDDGPSAAPFRAPSLSYLTQVALALEEAGFTSALIPTGSYCEDPWVVASSLVPLTRDLRLLVALHPRTTTPAYTAHRAATLQRISGGRLALNAVTGEPGREAWQHGDEDEKADQYARTGEFLGIHRALFRGEEVTRTGNHYRLREARLDRVGQGEVPLPVAPEIWFGGSSSHAGDVAARHADVYLSWLEPLEQLAEKIAWIRRLADEQGRKVRFGVRSWILLDGLDRDQQASARAALLSRQSVGQQRGQALLADADVNRPESLWIAPNIWGGFGLLAGGAALGFVGSGEQIANRFEDYRRLGVTEFIVSGFPNLEETRQVADFLVPELRSRGVLDTPRGVTGAGV
jgi:alkanesulfonate monooxygenase